MNEWGNDGLALVFIEHDLPEIVLFDA